MAELETAQRESGAAAATPPTTVAPADDLGRGYLARRQSGDQADVIARARLKAAQGKPAPAMPPEAGAATGGDTARDGGGGRSATGAVALDLAKGAVETPRAIVTGILGAAEEFTENVIQLTGLEGTLPPAADIFAPITPADPTSTTGQAVQGVTQFLTGWIPALRLTKLLNIGAKAGAAGKLAEGALAGSLADVAVIDEQEGRLSDLIEEVPALANPVTEFLQADPDDPIAVGKMKQAAEGLGLGAAADLFVQSLRFVAKVRASRAAQPGSPAAQVNAAAASTNIPIDEATLAPLTSKAPLIRVDESIRRAADDFLAGVPLEDMPERVGNINLARIGGPDDVREVIARTAQLFEDKVTGPVQSNPETVRLANEIAVDPDRMAEVLGRQGGQAFSAAEVTALRFLLQGSGRQLKTLAQSAIAGGDVEKFLFRRQMAFHAALLEQTSASAREAGRALQAFRITAEGGQEQLKIVQDFLKAGLGSDLDKAAQMVASLDTPEGLATFVRQASRATTSDMLIEAWINGLLSGPQTHAVNTLSNSLVALWQIPERRLAAGIRTLTGGQGVAAGEAQAQLFGLVKSLPEALRLAGRALRSGEASDALMKLEQPRHRAISARNMNLEESGIAGRAVDLLGEVVRTPGRFLLTEDEFFKAVGYRMELNARAYRQAAHEGLEGDAFARRVQELRSTPPEDLRLAAIDAARYQTFTKPLGEAGTSVQRAANKFPPLKLILPFIRTPANIVKFVGERSPLAPLSGAVRQEIAAGGARRDLALAKLSLGSLIMAAGADLAASGLITGGGPTDPDLRAAMRRTGWQPYSIKAGETYVSFQRLDPLGMTLGIAADLAEVIGQADQAGAEEAAAAAVMAVSQNLVSKTYLSGLADVIEVFASPSPELGASRGERFLQRFAGSAVPAAVAQTARVLDPTLRQADSVVQALRARIPGYSEDLPARLNLWGEKILLTGGVGPDIMSPLWASPMRDSPADEEIVRLGIPISMPTRTVGEVELTPEEYNRTVALAGNELKDPATGLGARETLEAMLAGNHPLAERYRTATDGPDGGKALIIRTVIQGFRAAAQAQVQLEIPELRQAIEQRRRAKAAALTGDGQTGEQP